MPPDTVMSGCLAGVSTFSNSDKPAGSAGGLAAGVLCASIGWSQVGQASLPVAAGGACPWRRFVCQSPVTVMTGWFPPIGVPPRRGARYAGNMRRAGRLFQIVQYLRARRLTTAGQLAGWLQVSERTVYRDIRDLSLSGVPVQGEAGMGYRLSPGFDLTPIMFTTDEVQALVAGARILEAWGGPALGGHARTAISKIALALPKTRRDEIDRARLFAVDFHIPQGAAAGLDTVRQAIVEHRKLQIEYRDRKSTRLNSSHRCISYA